MTPTCRTRAGRGSCSFPGAPFGRLVGIYGRRPFFQIGMVTFVAAHRVCAFATNGWVLIAGRGAGGIAASMLFSNTIAVLSDVFDKSERGKILGMNLSITYIGLTVGPFIGGSLHFRKDPPGSHNHR